MKETELRLLYHQMEGEMNLLYRKFIKTLGFVLAMEQEAYACPAQDEGPVLSEDSEDRIQQNWNILELLLANQKSSKSLRDVLDLAGIFTEETTNDIISIFEMKETGSGFALTYSYELEDIRYNAMFFYEVILSCYRMIALLEEEADGINEYGIENYVVDGEEFGISVLEGNSSVKSINHMGHKELEDEISKFIEEKPVDYEEDQEEKLALKEMLKHLNKWCKGKEKRK